MKHYHVYTAKSGDKFVQTFNKYLAHAMVFCGYEYKMFKVKDSVCYSFLFSEELLNTIEHINNIREK